MEYRTDADEVDRQLLDAFSGLIEVVIGRGEQIAKRLGVPAFCLKALHALDAPMAMRDIGRYLHCDPSFVTSIADLLEKRGLARREPSSVDRRIKNLVLTPEGIGLRSQAEHEFLARMPWRDALDEEERGCLLALIRKMTAACSDDAASGTANATTPPTRGAGAGEVTGTLTSAQQDR
jgi:DNA-binding MarR family transcriptional regulator